MISEIIQNLKEDINQMEMEQKNLEIKGKHAT